MSHNAVDIKKHVRTYIGVFIALACLTLLTVRVSYLHLAIRRAVAVALLIASVKGSLVAAYFMHLISEKKLIFLVLSFTVLFSIVLLLAPSVTTHEMVIFNHVP